MKKTYGLLTGLGVLTAGVSDSYAIAATDIDVTGIVADIGVILLVMIGVRLASLGARKVLTMSGRG